MAAKTVGFAIAEEDDHRLQELVDYFGQGNRSEFLRVAMEHMSRVKFADRIKSIQARVRSELNGRVLSEDEVAELVRSVKGKN